MVIKIENKLVLINLGDSNLILYKNGIKSLVMKEHLYSNPEEKERIDALVESGILSLNPGHAPKILNVGWGINPKSRTFTLYNSS